MRWLYIGAIPLMGYVTFVMAMAATHQLLGIHGRLPAGLFLLGPSWGWFAFDVAGFALGIGLIVVITYGLSR